MDYRDNPPLTPQLVPHCAPIPGSTSEPIDTFNEIGFCRYSGFGGQMATSRYYSEDDPETGVTGDELAALSPDEQRAYMLNWFERHYEDPALETSYNGREGGYLYVLGGPYDAREELQNEFAGLASDELIEEVAEYVESVDGVTDWAPGAEHSDHERAQEPGPADGEEPDPPARGSLLMAKQLKESVIQEAAKLAAEKDINITAGDRKPITFASITTLEQILVTASAASLRRAITEAATESYRGWMLDSVHDQAPPSTPADRPYPFRSDMGRLLPWWAMLERERERLGYGNADNP